MSIPLDIALVLMFFVFITYGAGWYMGHRACERESEQRERDRRYNEWIRRD